LWEDPPIVAGVSDDNELVHLRSALAHYERSPSPAALDEAFVAAAATVAALRGDRADEPADATEVRELMTQLPEFERLVAWAVDEAERAATAGAIALWQWFGLSSAPPAWDDAERSGARVIVACACAPLQADGAGQLRTRLRRLATPRWARLLTDELVASDEAVWRRALGGRYESIHRRYAPRSRWRTGELRDVVGQDPATAEAVRARLARWLTDSGDFAALPAELEAAFVQSRTPSRLA
jgi:hypothetical protein